MNEKNGKNIQNNEKKKLNLIDLLSLKYKYIKKNLKLFSWDKEGQNVYLFKNNN